MVVMAVLEAMVYDADGQCRTATFMDYLLPTAADVPAVTIEHIESPSIDAAGGFKGVGEGGAIGSPPAVINAITDAIGSNRLDMPATAEKVWAAMHAK